MTDIPVSPDMTSTPVPFADTELRAIYARIELIDKHFDACCAFQMDECHYASEYNSLYERLYSAGLPSVSGPISRQRFEAWLLERTPHS